MKALSKTQLDRAVQVITRKMNEKYPNKTVSSYPTDTELLKAAGFKGIIDESRYGMHQITSFIRNNHPAFAKYRKELQTVKAANEKINAKRTAEINKAVDFVTLSDAADVFKYVEAL